MEDKYTKDSAEPKEAESPPYSTEEKEAHPELAHDIKKSKKERLKELRRYKNRIEHRKMVEQLNRESITHLVQASSIVLAIIYLAFGVISVLSIFGITESNTWILFEATAFFGWEGHSITGFVLIIIGIVNLWSIPFYFLDNEQKADSYLIIGTGLGVLFGIIYLFIIIADILMGVVNCISDCTTFSITTYFYFPILLGLLTIPIFRILILRHTIFAPTDDDEDDDEGGKFDEEEYKKLLNEFPYYRGRRRWGRKHFRKKRWKW